MLYILGFFFLAFIAWPIFGSGSASLKYCSSMNTGSGHLANVSIYQSNGNCEKHCSEFAFAILQNDHCWCSSLAPAQQSNSDSSKCDDQCPGYPPDPCGNTVAGLYAYIPMSLNMPTGTASVSTTMSTTTAPPASTSSAVSKPETVTVTESISSSSPLATQSTTSDPSSTTSTSSSSESNTAIQTTVGGQVKTVTVGLPDPTSPSDSTFGAASTHSSGSHMGGGTIAGIVVGTVGGCAAIAAALFAIFIVRRRSRSNSPDPSFHNGLLDSNRGSKGPQMGFVRNMFSDNHSHSPSAESSSAQRAQTFTDNRMKTNTMLYQHGDRDSSVSLQDNEDYSRPVLRATNPD